MDSAFNNELPQAGRLGAALEREHREIDAGIDAFRAIEADGPGETEQDDAVAALLGAIHALRRHIHLEEELLFPPMHADFAIPIGVMLREHGEIWRTLEELEARLAESAGRSAESAGRSAESAGRSAESAESAGRSAESAGRSAESAAPSLEDAEPSPASAGGSGLLSACEDLVGQLDRHNSKEEPIFYTQADRSLDAEQTVELDGFLRSGQMPSGWTCVAARR